MADTETPTPETPGTVAVDHDGWETESFGQELPTRESVVQDLSEADPGPAEPAAPATARPSATPPAADEPTDTETPPQKTDATPAADDTTEKPGRVRGTDGKFKKISASERIAVQQAKIHANTKAAHEIEERIARNRTILEEQERRLAGQPSTAAEPGTKPAAKPAAKPGAKTATPAADAPAPKPRPRWDDYKDQDKTWKEYEDDLDAWFEERARATAREERDADRETAQQQQEAQARERWDRETRDAHNARIRKAKEKYPDWDDVMVNLHEVRQSPFTRDVVRLLDHPTENGADVLYYFTQNPEHCEILAELPMTTTMMDAVRSATSPIAMLAHFATHPQEVIDLSRQPAPVATWKLAQLDTKLATQTPGANTGSPRSAPVSNAKPPIGHLSGSRAVATSRPDDELDDDPNEDIASYIDRKNAAERARGGR